MGVQKDRNNAVLGFVLNRSGGRTKKEFYERAEELARRNPKQVLEYIQGLDLPDGWEIMGDGVKGTPSGQFLCWLKELAEESLGRTA